MIKRTILGGAILAAAIATAGSALAEMTPLPKVEKRGSGDVQMVLIPGFLSDWTVWEDFMERNKDQYTMYAVTLPGFGGTQPAPQPDSDSGTPWMDNAVEAVYSMINEKGLKEPVIVGHSMGGMIAMRLGLEHADAVGPVVTVDGMPAVPLAPQAVPEEQRVMLVEQRVAPQLLNMTEQQWAQQRTQFAQQVLGEQVENKDKMKEMFNSTPAPVAGRYMVEFMKSDLSDDLSEMKDPVLAMAAINDQAAGQGMTAEALQQKWKTSMSAAPNASFAWIEEGTHFLMLDKPEMFDKKLSEFVSSSKS